MLTVGYRSIISVPASPRVASTVATGVLIVVDAAIIIISSIPSVVCAWRSRTMPHPDKTFLCKMSIHKQRQVRVESFLAQEGLTYPARDIYLLM